MQTFHSPNGNLSESGSETLLPTRRVTLGLHQPTLTRGDIRRPFLFVQNPDNGPAVESRDALHPETPPAKRCELALDNSLYLPKSDDANFYGRFITLGYHQTAGPKHDPLRKRSERNKTFELWKRVKPNGWKFMVDGRSGLRATTILSAATRERLRTLSLNTPPPERVSTSIRVASIDRPDHVVEYTLVPSQAHDLFQFGRDPYNNDFHIPSHTIEGHTWYLSMIKGPSNLEGILFQDLLFEFNVVVMIPGTLELRRLDSTMRMNYFWDHMR